MRGCLNQNQHRPQGFECLESALTVAMGSVRNYLQVLQLLKQFPVVLVESLLESYKR
jgi:hypothetical protein